MSITKIVITGGPCAGKTAAMDRVKKEFTQMGCRMLFVPETATELKTGGVSAETCGSVAEFQRCLMHLQLYKEKVFEEAAQAMEGQKVLIVCDRGVMDGKAYMDAQDFARALEEIGANEREMRDRYDAVFHLVSAAKGASDHYTTENNAIRTETPQEAAILDDKVIAAWTGHPHLYLIEATENFEDKMDRLIAEIASFLGRENSWEDGR